MDCRFCQNAEAEKIDVGKTLTILRVERHGQDFDVGLNRDCRVFIKYKLTMNMCCTCSLYWPIHCADCICAVTFSKLMFNIRHIEICCRVLGPICCSRTRACPLVRPPLDWMSIRPYTSTHDVALVRIYNACLKCAACGWLKYRTQK